MSPRKLHFLTPEPIISAYQCTSEPIIDFFHLRIIGEVACANCPHMGKEYLIADRPIFEFSSAVSRFFHAREAPTTYIRPPGLFTYLGFWSRIPRRSPRWYCYPQLQ